jgi:hypothetical protein
MRRKVVSNRATKNEIEIEVRIIMLKSALETFPPPRYVYVGKK